MHWESPLDKGNERDRLDVTRLRGRDRCSGAVAQTADMRLQRAGADHLARFVCSGGDQRQALGNACRLGRLLRDFADADALEEPTPPAIGWVRSNDFPFPVPLAAQRSRL